MAERIVEHLEPIEVDEHQRERRVAPAPLLYLEHQRATVCESRQRIRESQPVKLGEPFLFDGDVLADADDTHQIAARIEHGIASALNPAYAAARMLNAVTRAAARL